MAPTAWPAGACALVRLRAVWNNREQGSDPSDARTRRSSDARAPVAHTADPARRRRAIRDGDAGHRRGHASDGVARAAGRVLSPVHSRASSRRSGRLRRRARGLRARGRPRPGVGRAPGGDRRPPCASEPGDRRPGRRARRRSVWTPTTRRLTVFSRRSSRLWPTVVRRRRLRRVPARTIWRAPSATSRVRGSMVPTTAGWSSRSEGSTFARERTRRRSRCWTASSSGRPALRRECCCWPARRRRPGDRTRAIQTLKATVAEAPDFFRGLSTLARLYEKLEQWDEAADTYAAAVEQNPSGVELGRRPRERVTQWRAHRRGTRSAACGRGPEPG